MAHKIVVREVIISLSANAVELPYCTDMELATLLMLNTGVTAIHPRIRGHLKGNGEKTDVAKMEGLRTPILEDAVVD